MRQSRIGDCPDDDPLILWRQREHLADEFFGLAGMASDDTSDEADEDAGRFCIPERSEPARRVHDSRHLGKIAGSTIIIDPFENGFARTQFARAQRRSGRRRDQKQCGRENCDDTTHFPLP